MPLGLGQAVQIEARLDRPASAFELFGIGPIDAGKAVQRWSQWRRWPGSCWRSEGGRLARQAGRRGTVRYWPAVRWETTALQRRDLADCPPPQPDIVRRQRAHAR